MIFYAFILLKELLFFIFLYFSLIVFIFLYFYLNHEMHQSFSFQLYTYYSFLLIFYFFLSKCCHYAPLFAVLLIPVLALSNENEQHCWNINCLRNSFRNHFELLQVNANKYYLVKCINLKPFFVNKSCTNQTFKRNFPSCLNCQKEAKMLTGWYERHESWYVCPNVLNYVCESTHTYFTKLVSYPHCCWLVLEN